MMIQPRMNHDKAAQIQLQAKCRERAIKMAASNHSLAEYVGYSMSSKKIQGMKYVPYAF